jgi:hypothetical protein
MLTSYVGWRQGETMPISRLLRNGKINSDEFERLDRAYKFTLRSLCLVDRHDPVCDIVARKVIEIDAAGTHDPREIASFAVCSSAYRDERGRQLRGLTS